MKLELYRITKGSLKNSKIEISMKFGMIYENEGLITLEMYVEEGVDLSIFNQIYFQTAPEYLTAFCVSEAGMQIEINKLTFKRIDPSRHYLEMSCYGSMLRTDIIKNRPIAEKSGDPILHYLVLEGLAMEYCTATEEGKTSRGKPIGKSNIKWDHTSSGWVAQQFLYNIDFYQDEENDSVIVEFDPSTNSTMTFNAFQALKKDFVYFLSFLNGAPVKIRKECFGDYKTIGKIDAEKVITYSFKKNVNYNHNEYIPLNHPLNRPINLLGRFFIYHFDAFSEWNKKIDLNSIIHYLNGAVQTRTLEEQFFILIIAFERLTQQYAEQFGPTEIFHPEKSNFQAIKNELLTVLEKHKDQFGEYFARAKSVIGGLNRVQKLSTKEKMYRMITDVKIDLTDDIAALIDIVRNNAVHKGDIGNEGVKNVYLLNDLLHETILKLINYLGPRKSTVLYGQTIMSIDTPIHGVAIYPKKAPEQSVT
jgi:hypothetical protein